MDSTSKFPGLDLDRGRNSLPVWVRAIKKGVAAGFFSVYITRLVRIFVKARLATEPVWKGSRYVQTYTRGKNDDFRRHQQSRHALFNCA